MNVVGFDNVLRLNRIVERRCFNKFDELSSQGPSSAGFARRNLVGLMGVMMGMANGGDEMKTITCNVTSTNNGQVRSWLESLSFDKPTIIVYMGEIVGDQIIMAWFPNGVINTNCTVLKYYQGSMGTGTYNIPSGSTGNTVACHNGDKFAVFEYS